LVKLNKLGAIAFAIFVFIGSVNIIVNQHLCNGDLESSALFLTATPCEHASNQNDLPPCHKKTANAKTCCDVNQIVIGSLSWFQWQNSEQIDLSNNSVSLLPALDNIFESKENVNYYSPEKVPKPPDDHDRVYISHQAFLL